MTQTVAGPASVPVVPESAPSASRISRRDAMPAGAFITTALSPLHVSARQDVVERLHRIMASGPEARVGRTFRGDRWEYDPARLARLAERMVRPLPPGTTPQTLASLRHDVPPDLGAMVFLGDDTGALVIDHRLGDGLLATVLVAAALGDRPPASVFSDASGDDPLPAALRETLWRHRDRIGGLLRDRLASPHRSTPVDDRVPAERKRLDLVTGHMSAPTLRAFSARVRGHAPLSLATVFALRGALREAGVPTLDEGVMLVNLRRYLPASTVTLGNFVTGLPVDLRGGLDTAGRLVTHQLRVGRPLAAHAVGLLRPGRPARPGAATVPAAAMPVVSDMGLLRAFEPLAWRGAEKSIAMSVDPATRNGVTALTAVLGGRLNVSLSFDGSLFDPADLARACTILCDDPIGMLTR